MTSHWREYKKKNIHVHKSNSSTMKNTFIAFHKFSLLKQISKLTMITKRTNIFFIILPIVKLYSLTSSNLFFSRPITSKWYINCEEIKKKKSNTTCSIFSLHEFPPPQLDMTPYNNRRSWRRGTIAEYIKIWVTGRDKFICWPKRWRKSGGGLEGWRREGWGCVPASCDSHLASIVRVSLSPDIGYNAYQLIVT